MRTLILIATFFLSFELFAQNQPILGNDDNSILNKDEVELLNTLLSNQRDTFDFTNKKVAFITGSTGRSIVTKSDYFNKSVKPWIENNSQPQISMVKLTKDEKKKSGGYDVLVLSWVKIFTPRSQEKVIALLGVKNKGSLLPTK